MSMQEDIIAKLIAVPRTKIDGRPTQSDISNLENELAEHDTKIKTMEDIVEQGKRYVFLIIIVGLSKCKTIIGNPLRVGNEPEGSGPYDNSIAATDTTFAQSKKE